MTQIVDFALVDAGLEETGPCEKRLRLLPSRVVVYYVLALGQFERLPARTGICGSSPLALPASRTDSTSWWGAIWSCAPAWPSVTEPCPRRHAQPVPCSPGSQCDRFEEPVGANVREQFPREQAPAEIRLRFATADTAVRVRPLHTAPRRCRHDHHTTRGHEPGAASSPRGPRTSPLRCWTYCTGPAEADLKEPAGPDGCCCPDR